MKYRLHSDSVPERQYFASDHVIHFERKRKKKRRPPKQVRDLGAEPAAEPG